MFKALIIKEFKQFFRNPFLPRIAVVMPMLIILVLPFVVTMDVKNIKVGVVDQDNTPATLLLQEKISSSPYFRMQDNCYSYEDGIHAIEEGQIDALVTIRDGFENMLVQMMSGQGASSSAPVEIAANATDATKGSMGGNYLSAIVSGFVTEYTGAPDTGTISQLNLFNESNDYKTFMLPALMGMIIIMMSGVFPTIAIVSEKESGSIDQINVTPVTRLQFILSKLIPYWIVGLAAVSIAFVLAALVYGFTPAGSYLTIYLASFLMILTMSGVGLVISNNSSTFLQAILLFFFVMIIMMLMSGLFTPVSSMPRLTQIISYALPPRYFMEIMRGVFLKGSSVGQLMWSFIPLAVFAFLSSSVAVFTYRKRV